MLLVLCPFYGAFSCSRISPSRLLCCTQQSGLHTDDLLRYQVASTRWKAKPQASQEDRGRKLHLSMEEWQGHMQKSMQALKSSGNERSLVPSDQGM